MSHLSGRSLFALAVKARMTWGSTCPSAVLQSGLIQRDERSAVISCPPPFIDLTYVEHGLALASPFYLPSI